MVYSSNNFWLWLTQFVHNLVLLNHNRYISSYTDFVFVFVYATEKKIQREDLPFSIG